MNGVLTSRLAVSVVVLAAITSLGAEKPQDVPPLLKMSSGGTVSSVGEWERIRRPEIQKTFGAIVEAQGDMTQVKGDSVMPVINMLNAKYFIMPLQGGKTAPLENPYAMGNGWFVDEVQFVDNANAELDALGKINLHTTAVADKKFESTLKTAVRQDSPASVQITSYAPNELHYDVSSAKGGVVVFSEIYYPGWTCTVDGNPVEIVRVNYVLRAINVPAGSHKVVMEFRPKSIETTETVAYTALALLVACVLCIICMQVWRKKK